MGFISPTYGSLARQSGLVEVADVETVRIVEYNAFITFYPDFFEIIPPPRIPGYIRLAFERLLMKPNYSCSHEYLQRYGDPSTLGGLVIQRLSGMISLSHHPAVALCQCLLQFTIQRC
jgi:hypothetical protein